MESPDAEDPGAQPAAQTVEPREDAQVTTESAPPSSAAPAAECYKLDVRSISLARLVNAIVSSVIVVAALLVGSLLWWVIPFPVDLLIPLSWLAIAGITTVSVGWWPRWEHDAWSYRVCDRVVELSHGVVWRASVSIPLSRLQHVDLHRGPLERRWGLASLEIHTAGTRDASHRIPGLDVEIASDLRDRLIDAANRGPHAAAKD